MYYINMDGYQTLLSECGQTANLAPLTWCVSYHTRKFCDFQHASVGSGLKAARLTGMPVHVHGALWVQCLLA